MKNFKIYLKTWNHILANVVTAQVVNAVNKRIDPEDWQPSEKVLIYKDCDLSDEEIEKIREAVTEINCRFVLEKMNAYEEKVAARRERCLQKAESLRNESAKHYDTAMEMCRAIPLGQPVLIGHHSEKKDLAFRGRMAKHMEKSMELNDKAEYYADKAETVGTGGISSDDPDAISKLTEKLSKLKEKQDFMKAVNSALRLKDASKGDSKLRELNLSDEEIQKLREPDCFGHIGFAPFELSNNNANIRRIEKRIADLKARQEREPVAVHGEFYEYKVEDNRCQFIFAGKPSEEVRKFLKGYAFKWSPSRGAWVRQASKSGIFAADTVKNFLDNLKAG